MGLLTNLWRSSFSLSKMRCLFSISMRWLFSLSSWRFCSRRLSCNLIAVEESVTIKHFSNYFPKPSELCLCFNCIAWNLELSEKLSGCNEHNDPQFYIFWSVKIGSVTNGDGIIAIWQSACYTNNSSNLGEQNLLGKMLIISRGNVFSTTNTNSSFFSIYLQMSFPRECLDCMELVVTLPQNPLWMCRRVHHRLVESPGLHRDFLLISTQPESWDNKHPNWQTGNFHGFITHDTYCVMLKNRNATICFLFFIVC